MKNPENTCSLHKVHQKQSESFKWSDHTQDPLAIASPSPQVLSTPGPPGLSWAALLWLRYKGRSSPPRPRGRQHSAPAGEPPWSEGRASPARTARPRELLEGRWGEKPPQGWGNLNLWWCHMMSMYLGKKPFGFYDGDWGKIEGSWSSWWSWWGKNAWFFPTKLPFKNHHNFQCMSSTFLRIILPSMQHVLLIKEVNMVTVRKRIQRIGSSVTAGPSARSFSELAGAAPPQRRIWSVSAAMEQASTPFWTSDRASLAVTHALIFLAYQRVDF